MSEDAVTETARHSLPDADTARAHLAAFDGLAEALPGADVPWVGALRTRAFMRFTEQGLPTRRLEDWKFTGLDVLARAAFAPEAPGTGALPDAAFLDALAPLPDALRLVFVNGAFRPELSETHDAPGVRVAPLSARLAAGDGALEGWIDAGGAPARALVALNAAFMTDGAAIVLDYGATLARPVVLLFLTGGDGRAAHVRNVVALGADAEARVIEVHATLPGAAPAFANAVTDLRLGPGARLHHGRVAAEAPGALHHSYAAAAVERGARYASLALTVGGDLVRLESDVTFAGPRAEAQLLGAYLARGRQHMDHTTRVRHAHPHCATEELFKGALEDRAHGVFQGLIRVEPHAVGTDARQQNRNLLLSSRAVADSKPELEILADDVKCSHGATVGDLDADELFYLAARGIAPADARRLLVAGFVEDVTGRAADPAVRAVAEAHARHWLGEEP